MTPVCTECGLDEPLEGNVIHAGGRLLCLSCSAACGCNHVDMRRGEELVLAVPDWVVSPREVEAITAIRIPVTAEGELWRVTGIADDWLPIVPGDLLRAEGDVAVEIVEPSPLTLAQVFHVDADSPRAHRQEARMVEGLRTQAEHVHFDSVPTVATSKPDWLVEVAQRADVEFIDVLRYPSKSVTLTEVLQAFSPPPEVPDDVSEAEFLDWLKGNDD